MAIINESAARIAKELSSFSDYVEGSATASYNAQCAEAAAILEQVMIPACNLSITLSRFWSSLVNVTLSGLMVTLSQMVYAVTLSQMNYKRLPCILT